MPKQDESRTVFDPFRGQQVEISSRLTDRLRGRYAIGPTMPNGEPEFGWREHGAPPIHVEAAEQIEKLTTAVHGRRTEILRLCAGELAKRHPNHPQTGSAAAILLRAASSEEAASGERPADAALLKAAALDLVDRLRSGEPAATPPIRLEAAIAIEMLMGALYGDLARMIRACAEEASTLLPHRPDHDVFRTTLLDLAGNAGAFSGKETT